MADTPSVTLIDTIAGVRGERFACGPGRRWTAAERRLVLLDAEGETLAAAAQRRPARPAGTGASSVRGPSAWLTLLDGRARTRSRPLIAY
jgi:hypothetical protein